eukprot:TRINITY_DN28035_c0_g1_i1.p1 TRINITY_DN28035_c0_g1~~TRINITY_DN28035_c0_g1_i1.p1  ORF type:complete len:320 (+),score=71.25 TRINITY_DN28035_c0_g1_i1:75-1034(+)
MSMTEIQVRRVEPQVVGIESGFQGESSSRIPAAENLSLANRSSSSSSSRSAPEDRTKIDEDLAISFVKDAEMPEQEALSESQQWWAMILLAVSSLDLLLSGSIMGVSLKFAYQDDGVSLYCLASQSLSHLASSLALLMRLMGDLLPQMEPSTCNQDVEEALLLRARRRRDLVREQAIGITMGVIILLGSAGFIFKAFRKLEFWDMWHLDHQEQDEELERVTDILAWWGFGTYALEAVLRLWCARRLRRSTVWHSFFVSLISMLFLLVLGFAASYERGWSWKAEPIAAMALVVISLIEGVRILVHHLGDVDSTLQHERCA